MTYQWELDIENKSSVSKFINQDAGNKMVLCIDVRTMGSWKPSLKPRSLMAARRVPPQKGGGDYSRACYALSQSPQFAIFMRCGCTGWFIIALAA